MTIKPNRILLVTAVDIEQEALQSALMDNSNIDVVTVGVGLAAAAASTATVLARSPGVYRLVISAGIGGGFVNHSQVGGIVLADSIHAADLGVETAHDYQNIEQLGLGSSSITIDKRLCSRLHNVLLQKSGLAVNLGPILTVSTVSGTSASAKKLSLRIPKAAAEAMEGFGVATAARLHDLPVLEIRAISNVVGPRDRSAWRIPDALQALHKAASILEEFLKKEFVE